MVTETTTENECWFEDILSVKELKPIVRQSLKNVIEKEGFTTYKVKVKDISTEGGNYLGILQTVTVKGKSDDGDKQLNLFLKNIVTVGESNSVLNSSDAYLREGFFYKNVLKQFSKIQEKYNIPQDEKINAVKVYDDSNGEVIIMDDISDAGYKTYDRCDVVSVKFAELSIEQLAKLHAMSFVLRKEHPIYFENNVKTLSTLFKFNANFETHVRRIFDKAVETLEGDAKHKLDRFFSSALEKYKKYMDFPADQAVCLCHADFRANNILVKEIEGEPIAVIPVDYQLMNYGYPVTDFLYFIFAGTDQEFRKNHLEDLKELYWRTLDTFLGKFGIEAKEVYSRKQFEEEYRELLDYGLLSFLALMPFIFAKNDDIPDMENGLGDMSLNLDERFKERLREIVYDYIQWGYL
ncbi:hypothetical protein ABMA28_004348 [Loxostege sticticalis]|uniref:CHK kinase-like domain-containing protein n=1 Tax=Loxostege sticticalis TaxID=481309 RepID=A0ABD0ST56_LOXSC